MIVQLEGPAPWLSVCGPGRSIGAWSRFAALGRRVAAAEGGSDNGCDQHCYSYGPAHHRSA